jgi:hypothetical protein
MIEIGTVEIPIVSTVNPVEESELTEKRGTGNSVNSLNKHTPERTTLIINGFLNQELHSSSFSLDKQKDDLRSLTENSLVENPINYKSWKGHLILESVEIADTSDSRIITEVTLESKFHPWPKFCPESEP